MNTNQSKREYMHSVLLWCDGTFCEVDELEDYIHMGWSDDVREVFEDDPDYPEELKEN